MKDLRIEGLSIAVDCSNVKSDGAVAIQNSLIEDIIDSHTDEMKIYLICNYEFQPRLSRNNVDVIRVNFSNRFTHFLWYIFNLNQLLKKLKCNELYLLGGYYLGTFRPFNSIVQNLLPLDNKIIKTYPFILQTKLFLLNRFYNYSFKRAKRLFYLTQHSLKYVPNIIKKKTVSESISFNLEVKEVPKSLNFGSKKNERFLYVANITEYKNHVRLVKAFSVVYQKNPEIRLTFIGRIVGKESNRILEDIFSIESSKEFVRFDGYISRIKIGEYYLSHCCLIYPSLVESLGVPLYEAILFDLPILCSDKIGLVPILELGKTNSSRFGKFGYTNEVDDNIRAYKKVNYFDPYSVESIVKSIEEFIG